MSVAFVVPLVSSVPVMSVAPTRLSVSVSVAAALVSVAVVVMAVSALSPLLFLSRAVSCGLLLCQLLFKVVQAVHF